MRQSVRRVRSQVLAITAALMALAAGCASQPSAPAGSAAPSAKAAAATPSAAVSPSPGSDAITQQETGIKLRVEMKEIASFLSMSKEGPIIPGLMQNAVPQGLAYVPAQKWLVVSYYRDKSKPSFLSILDETTGKLIKSVMLQTEPGKAYTGHAGGVTFSGKHLWISSDGYLYQLKLEDVVNAKDGDAVVFAGTVKTEVRSSFSAYSDGILWAGEFAYGKDYPTSETHYMDNREGKQHKAWVVGYKLDPATDLLPAGKKAEANGVMTPDYILSIPDAVQGMEINKDRVILSSSYNRNNPGVLLKYANPLSGTPQKKVKIGSAEVPVWLLDGQAKQAELISPPMTEGVADTPAGLYVLFESGAAAYRSNGAYPLDHLYLLNWK
ncbi:hypothetical protein N6H14_02415 [Paenibacillus sp. CC-CFT747]|nr:hypothetical protein N6H14_02415 [Paenibacillus sp. CC-CFT747]